MLVFGGLFSGLETQSEVSRLMDELYGSTAQGNLGEAEEFGASQRGAKDLSQKGAYEEESTGRFVLEYEPEQYFSSTFQNVALLGYHNR
jgi:hypothetical protein